MIGENVIFSFRVHVSISIFVMCLHACAKPASTSSITAYFFRCPTDAFSQAAGAAHKRQAGASRKRGFWR